MSKQQATSLDNLEVPVPESIVRLARQNKFCPFEHNGRTLVCVDAEWFWNDPHTVTTEGATE
ncbi:hypothetical protein [Schlesneria sp. DSM 10557]|uniref:hypothetical protein n=1 Tax=Schlesneria sp. DSM 10557 TaxID=3044399 RepID=UPI00359F76A2